MKKVLMYILTIIIAIIISVVVLYVNVFSKKAKIDIIKKEIDQTNIIQENEITGYEKQISDAEEKAITEINSNEITEVKIEEAITYIEKNIEVAAEEKNIETIEKMAYYGAYLKNLVVYEKDEKKSEISILGENTLIYTKEALKFIENDEKTKEKTPEETTKDEAKTEKEPIEVTPTENIPETSATPIATPIKEPTETPVVINIIEVNTSTTLENAKTKVRGSISKVNNLNRKKLVTELKEKITNSSQNN